MEQDKSASPAKPSPSNPKVDLSQYQSTVDAPPPTGVGQATLNQYYQLPDGRTIPIDPSNPRLFQRSAILATWGYLYDGTRRWNAIHGSIWSFKSSCLATYCTVAAERAKTFVRTRETRTP
eukprot:Gregarina_sp_Poly_1__4785@NODE_2550_length_1995_cov_7_846992_g1619_i0_p3_GENE_NODE_2550_length_1995_cov_7_846992_g1619_i0NODE_2550_length_1995_cov_7_846992_g1619_i0_p3_ORF_typecomplete_len121_score7_93_NODE_2550_length_1995_cov_7_846992_g1619_i015801942